MLPVRNVADGTYDRCLSTNDGQWRVSLALDLDERSVLEGEVLLARISEQTGANGTMAGAGENASRDRHPCLRSF
jgi:hypothetical protein